MTDTELPPRPSLGAALATLADSPTAASQAVSYLLALPHSDPSQLQDFCAYLPSELFSVELAEVVAAVNDADVNRVLAYRAAASAAVTDLGQRFLSSRRHEVPRPLPPDTAAVVLEALSKDRRRSTGDALATYLPLLLPFLAVRLSSVSDSNLNPSSLDSSNFGSSLRVSPAAARQAVTVLRAALRHPGSAMTALRSFVSAFELAGFSSPLARSRSAGATSPSWSDLAEFFAALTPGCDWSEAVAVLWEAVVDEAVEAFGGIAPRKLNFTALSSLPLPIRRLFVSTAEDPASLVMAVGDAGTLASPDMRVVSARRLFSLAWVAPAVATASAVPFARFWSAVTDLLDARLSGTGSSDVPASLATDPFLGSRAHPEWGETPVEVVAAHMLVSLLSAPGLPPLGDLDRVALRRLCRRLHKWVKSSKLDRYRVDVPVSVVNAGFGAFANPEVVYGLDAARLEALAEQVARSVTDVAPVVADALGIFTSPPPSPAPESFAARFDAEISAAARTLPSSPSEVLSRWISATAEAHRVSPPDGVPLWDGSPSALYAVTRSHVPHQACVALWSASVGNAIISHPDPRVEAASHFVDPRRETQRIPDNKLVGVVAPGVDDTRSRRAALLSFAGLAARLGAEAFLSWLLPQLPRFFTYSPSRLECLELVGELLCDSRPSPIAAALRGVSVLDPVELGDSYASFAPASQLAATWAALLPVSAISDPFSPEAKAWGRFAARIGDLYSGSGLLFSEGDLGSAFDDVASVVMATAPHLASAPEVFWESVPSKSERNFWLEVAASRHAALAAALPTSVWPSSAETFSAFPLSEFTLLPAPVLRHRPDFDEAVLSLAISDAELLAGRSGYFDSFSIVPSVRDSLPLAHLLVKFPTLLSAVTDALGRSFDRGFTELSEWEPDSGRHPRFFSSMRRAFSASRVLSASAGLSRADLCWADVAVASMAALASSLATPNRSFTHLPHLSSAEVVGVLLSILAVRTPTHPRLPDDSAAGSAVGPRVPVLAKLASGVGVSTPLSKPASVAESALSRSPSSLAEAWDSHRDLLLSALRFCGNSWLPVLCPRPYQLPAAAKRLLLPRASSMAPARVLEVVRVTSLAVWGPKLGTAPLVEVERSFRTYGPLPSPVTDALAEVAAADADGSVPLVDGPSRAGLDLLLSSPALADELEPAALTAAASALTTVAADLAALPLGVGSDGLAELRRRLEFLFLFKPHITPELFWELTLGLVTSPHAASLWRSLSVEDAVPLLELVASVADNSRLNADTTESLLSGDLPLWVVAGLFAPSYLLRMLPPDLYGEFTCLASDLGADMSLWVSLLSSWDASTLALLRTAAAL